ncbi:hypothetical protein NQ315_011513 [Exocentrus adspersus]|uniref:Uncharacterized protein n=1 Tax=Exocentrus adspersus TaxID=1586481 RepID=A0AAV8VVG0_9CUCU|nr:hypothetical protein NQ315_011513 [Exocentrus adspersus]
MLQFKIIFIVPDSNPESSTIPCRSTTKTKPNCSIVNNSTPTGDYSAAAGDTYVGGPQRGSGYSAPTQSYHPYRR